MFKHLYYKNCNNMIPLSATTTAIGRNSSSRQSNSDTTTSSSRALIVGFISGCCSIVIISATVKLVQQQYRRRRQQLQEQRTSRKDNDAAITSKVFSSHRNSSNKNISTNVLPKEIRDEQLSRHTLYFGTEGMDRLYNAKVCIVGVGGVGSHTAHMIARSGIRYIRIIDYDYISVSSLNRHAMATLHDVGTSKVQCLANFLEQICPDPQYLFIDPIAEMYTEESSERLLQLPSTTDKWDMIIDCIDDIKTKAALLSYCIQNQIRVLSCMGAGGKADPTRLHISDLRSAAKDPLATKIRQYLKSYMKKIATRDVDDERYLDDMNQLTVIYNSEKTVVKLADFTDEQKEMGVHNFGAIDGMRIRVIPVLGTMPAIMGQALASYCITVLADQYQIQPVTCERIGRNTRNKMYQTLRTREQNITGTIRKQMEVARSTNEQCVSVTYTNTIHGTGELVSFYNESDHTIQSKVWIGELQIDQFDDMEYILEIWRNRCSITGARLGTVLHLVRWDLRLPSTCDNIIVICSNILKEYERNPYEYQEKKIKSHVREAIVDRLLSCRVDR